MIQTHCPHCQRLLQVADSLGGSLVRCPDCDGVLRLPHAETETEGPAYHVPATPEEPHRAPEVQDFVKRLEDEVIRKEQERPYHIAKRPYDTIAGWFFIGCGVLLLLNSFLGGGNLMAMFCFGVILPGFFFLLGAACFISKG